MRKKTHKPFNYKNFMTAFSRVIEDQIEDREAVSLIWAGEHPWL